MCSGRMEMPESVSPIRIKCPCLLHSLQRISLDTWDDLQNVMTSHICSKSYQQSLGQRREQQQPTVVWNESWSTFAASAYRHEKQFREPCRRQPQPLHLRKVLFWLQQPQSQSEQKSSNVLSSISISSSSRHTLIHTFDVFSTIWSHVLQSCCILGRRSVSLCPTSCRNLFRSVTTFSFGTKKCFKAFSALS